MNYFLHSSCPPQMPLFSALIAHDAVILSLSPLCLWDLWGEGLCLIHSNKDRAQLLVGGSSGHGSIAKLALAIEMWGKADGSLLGEESLSATVSCFLFGVISESAARICCSHLAVQVEQALGRSQWGQQGRELGGTSAWVILPLGLKLCD